MTILDLRKIGLSRKSWRELRFEARSLGVPVGIVVESVIIPEWLRQKRRRRKA